MAPSFYWTKKGGRKEKITTNMINLLRDSKGYPGEWLDSREIT
jgi:hypothetical protein